MTELDGTMHFALREITRFRVPVVIWIVLTVVAAVAGPFGTFEAMGLGGRALYWGSVIAGSIVLNLCAVALADGRVPKERFGVWVGFALLVSGVVHGVNGVVFPTWGGIEDWAYLAGIVGMVTAAVHLVLRAVLPEAEPEKVQSDTFLRRLPIELRAPLVRIEAQDHYLNVVTAKGNTLILMHLGDATAELSGLGIQVHRSHWVAPAAVKTRRREKGRDLLVMADGAEVPVSRSYRAAVQDAGLL
ncbi:LytTR family DNA-binding domain-containing protein [Sulfitobacter sp.]|uniref:LytTR family DNA-binding domain-containing protein n=1 Tax=Sulfitobacter sp. TaxID=1903071 RepID=UPI0030026E3A